jgi:hypothetical protein
MKILTLNYSCLFFLASNLPASSSKGIIEIKEDDERDGINRQIIDDVKTFVENLRKSHEIGGNFGKQNFVYELQLYNVCFYISRVESIRRNTLLLSLCHTCNIIIN